MENTKQQKAKQTHSALQATDRIMNLIRPLVDAGDGEWVNDCLDRVLGAFLTHVSFIPAQSVLPPGLWEAIEADRRRKFSKPLTLREFKVRKIIKETARRFAAMEEGRLLSFGRTPTGGSVCSGEKRSFIISADSEDAPRHHAAALSEARSLKQRIEEMDRPRLNVSDEIESLTEEANWPTALKRDQYATLGFDENGSLKAFPPIVNADNGSLTASRLTDLTRAWTATPDLPPEKVRVGYRCMNCYQLHDRRPTAYECCSGGHMVQRRWVCASCGSDFTWASAAENCRHDMAAARDRQIAINRVRGFVPWWSQRLQLGSSVLTEKVWHCGNPDCRFQHAREESAAVCRHPQEIPEPGLCTNEFFTVTPTGEIVPIGDRWEVMEHKSRLDCSMTGSRGDGAITREAHLIAHEIVRRIGHGMQRLSPALPRDNISPVRVFLEATDIALQHLRAEERKSKEPNGGKKTNE